ncbi:MAG: hypothetical protein AB7G80_08815 [Dongiaceae bacterium]
MGIMGDWQKNPKDAKPEKPPALQITGSAIEPSFANLQAPKPAENSGPDLEFLEEYLANTREARG